MIFPQKGSKVPSSYPLFSPFNTLLTLLPLFIFFRRAWLTDEQGGAVMHLFALEQADAGFAGLPVPGFLCADDDDEVFGGERLIPQKCCCASRSYLAKLISRGDHRTCNRFSSAKCRDVGAYGLGWGLLGR